MARAAVFIFIILNLTGAMAFSRPVVVVIANVALAGLSGFACYLTATGGSSSLEIVIFGLLTVFNGVMAIKEFKQLRIGLAARDKTKSGASWRRST